jgi:GntR family transcriptional repressor for pyruvate dehydrogenase complex
MSDLAVDQIAASIEEGHYGVGDWLPTERELVSQLGMSRASTREALRILEAQGLIKVIPGRGASVVGIPARADVETGLQAWFVEHHGEAAELLEVRALLEGYAVRIAAQTISPQKLQELQANLAQMRSFIERHELTEATACDRSFHRLLYVASGNQFLGMLGDSIVATLFSTRYSIIRIPGRADQSLREHSDIVKCIQERDADGAVRSINYHMQSIREAIRLTQVQAL